MQWVMMVIPDNIQKKKKYSFKPINKNITIIPIRADSY